jgi:Transglycosylase SLT domain
MGLGHWVASPKRPARWTWLALSIMPWMLPSPSVAAPPATPTEPAAMCMEALRYAEQRYGTPPGLLAAIAKTESGRSTGPRGEVQPWAWAVNIGGAGAYFETKQAAILAVQQAIAVNAGYVDVGCMQVNLQFHPRAFRSLEEAFDPIANADYATRFLVSLRDAAAGNWFIAVGMYHSRSPDLAQLYRERVTMAGTAIRPAGAGKLRITLGNGRVAVVNINRQPSRVRRHRSACEIAAILGSYLASNVRVQACAAQPASRPAADGKPQPTPVGKP